eukprot:scaffold74843_cov40-Phaeocystis_antarctica.AAC.1
MPRRARTPDEQTPRSLILTRLSLALDRAGGRACLERGQEPGGPCGGRHRPWPARRHREGPGLLAAIEKVRPEPDPEPHSSRPAPRPTSHARTLRRTWS